jgi:hypothetical protein
MTLMPVSNIFGLRLELVEGRRVAVDRPAVLGLEVGPLVTGEVQRLAQHVVDVAERRGAHRHRDRPAGVDHLGATPDTVGGLHDDGADASVAHVLRDLGGQLRGLAADRAVERAARC